MQKINELDNQDKKIISWFFVLLCIQYTVSPEITFLLNIALCIIVAYRKKKLYLNIIPGFSLLIVLFIYTLGITLIQALLGSSIFQNVIRDMFYMANGLIAILVGFFLNKLHYRDYQILNTFILGALYVVFGFWINLIQGNELSSIRSINNVETWRSSVGTGSLFVPLALVIIISGIVDAKHRLSKLVIIPATVLFIGEIVITFSRASIILILILYLFLYKNKKRLLKRLVIILLIIVSVIWLLSYFRQFTLVDSVFEKFSNTLTEISSSDSFTSVANIQKNWRGFEVYSAKQQWLTSGTFNQIFGGGFGKLINVGYLSILVDPTSNGYIPVLHNGYYTLIIKSGFIGVLLYGLFYFWGILFGLRKNSRNNLSALYFSGCMLFMAIQTIFLNGLFKDSINLALIYLIGYWGNRALDNN